MNILSETKALIEALDLKVETGIFKYAAPNNYVVLVPLNDLFPISADNYPLTEVQELRITLYSKENYIKLKNKIVRSLLDHDFTITGRKFNGYETDTSYYQYTIDVEKIYDLQEE